MAALIVAAFAWDLSARRTVQFPFAARDIAAGDPIDASAVRWREVPAGLFTLPALDGATANVAIAAGEPITAPTAGAAPLAPEGWWAIPVDLAPGAAPGDEVLLVVTDPPLTVPGVVVTAGSDDRYGLDSRSASVAVPAEAAAVVAAASRSGLVVAATRP